MIANLLHEDKALKKVAHTPKDQKPRFQWSAPTAGNSDAKPSTPSAFKVKVGGNERDFDMGEIADTVGSALADAEVVASAWPVHMDALVVLMSYSSTVPS